MISVQNPRQLLNGNNILLFFISIFFLSSCGIFSSSHKHKPRYKTKKKKVVKKTDKNKSKVDSIHWPNGDDIIKSDEDKYGSEKKYSYTVDLLIPLEASKHYEGIEDIEKSHTNKYLHYYTGVMLALEDLHKKGIDITLNVYDAPVKNDRISTIKRKLDSDQPDVIIGPRNKNQLKTLSYYAKSKNITIVSPWMAISKSVKNNPNYIQLKPELNKYYSTIIENVDKNYSAKDVYLIGLDTKSHKGRLRKLQKIHKENDKSLDKYNTFYINKDSLENGEYAFGDIFKGYKGGKKIFILPNWSYKDEVFLYSTLRRLNIEKGEQKVIVYGMPILMNSNKIGYNLFKRLNIRVVSPSYIEPGNYNVKKFINRFYDKVQAFPEDKNYAYDGYDMMMFVGENLSKFGTKFQYFIEGDEQNYLNSSFKLIRKVSDENIRDEKLDKIDCFENTKLHILGFNRNKFEKFK